MQVNGKKKGSIVTKADSNQEQVITEITKNEQTNLHMQKIQPIKKTIFVKNKLINFVT